MDEEVVVFLFFCFFLMDYGVARYFTRFGGNLFVDLWEAQPCLWDPEC